MGERVDEMMGGWNIIQSHPRDGNEQRGDEGE